MCINFRGRFQSDCGGPRREQVVNKWETISTEKSSQVIAVK